MCKHAATALLSSPVKSSFLTHVEQVPLLREMCHRKVDSKVGPTMGRVMIAGHLIRHR